MKSGVFAFSAFLILALSVSFVSAGLMCNLFGINCDSDLRGELYSGGGDNCEGYSLNVVSDSTTRVSDPGQTVVTRDVAEAPADWSGFGPIPGTKWIYHPTNNNARYSNYYYEKTFNVEEGFEDYEAQLSISADDSYIAYLNGNQIGSGFSHRITNTHDVSQHLEVGENLLRVRVRNNKHSSSLNFEIVISADCVPVVIDEGPLVPECQWADRNGNGIVDTSGPDIDQFAECHGSSRASNLGCFWADRDNSGDVSHGDNVPLANCIGKRVPTTPYCEESDGGHVSGEKGAINYKDGNTNDIDFDTCINGDYLSEHFCRNNLQETAITYCDFGCDDGACLPDPCADVSCEEGFSCSEGECVEDEVVVECTESDEGVDIYARGENGGDLSLFLDDPNSADSVSDFCLQLEEGEMPWVYDSDYPSWDGSFNLAESQKDLSCEEDCGVYEFFCGSEVVEGVDAHALRCPFGCSEGACLPDPCEGVECSEGYYCDNGDCREIIIDQAEPEYVILRDFGVIKTSGRYEKGADADQVDYLSTLFEGFMDGESTRYTIENALYDQDIALVVGEFEEEITMGDFEDYVDTVLKANGYDLDYDPAQVYDYSEDAQILFSSSPDGEDLSVTWISRNIFVSIYFEDFRSIDRINEDSFQLMLETYQDKYPSSIDFQDDDTDPTYQVCEPLIEENMNPEDIIDNGNAYELNHHGSYENDWYVNNERESYITYYASYRSLNDDDFGRHINIYQEVSVFENIEVDAVDVVEEQTKGTVCIRDNYWGRDDTDNAVYICNWNALRDNQDLGDRHQHYTREIYWADNNVMVRVNVNFGKYLSEEEVERLATESLIDLLDKLKDNNFEYVTWDNFDIPWQARNFIERSLSQCNSEIKHGEDTCNPSWQCKTEPLICPPHGEQTRTCYDARCDLDDQVSISHCSPGICSGCYVSKWYDSRDNRCIPYGFRFEEEGEERVKIEEVQFDETVSEGDLNDGREDYGLEILSDTEAQLLFAGELYDLVEGENVRVRNEEYREDILYYDLEIIDVVEPTEEDQGYVDMTIRYEAEVSYREKIPSYCEIDGSVYTQKTKDFDGSWASCQNNYECESNICSNGECVDTKSAIQQAGALRAFFIKVVCRISTLAGDSYDQCLADAGLGEVAVPEPVEGDFDYTKEISGYELQGSPHVDKGCVDGEELGPTLGIESDVEYCLSTVRLEYVNQDNEGFFVTLAKFTENYHSYHNYIYSVSQESSITNVRTFNEPWELVWFSVNDGDYYVATSKFTREESDFGYSYSYDAASTEDDPVIEDLLERYPPILIA